MAQDVLRYELFFCVSLSIKHLHPNPRPPPRAWLPTAALHRAASHRPHRPQCCLDWASRSLAALFVMVLQCVGPRRPCVQGTPAGEQTEGGNEW